MLLLIDCLVLLTMLVGPCFEVIKLEYSLRIKITRNDWLLSDTSQAQNKAQLLAACGHVSASSQSLRFILSLRMNSSFITSRPCFVIQCLVFFLVLIWYQ